MRQFSVLQYMETGCGMHQPAVQWVQKVKWPGPEAEHSPLWFKLCGNQGLICRNGNKFVLFTKVVCCGSLTEICAQKACQLCSILKSFGSLACIN